MAVPAGPSLSPERTRELREWLAAHQDEMVADLGQYVSRESPSDDVYALRRCLDWVTGWLEQRLGAPYAVEKAGSRAIFRYAGSTGGPYSAGDPVLLLAHYDTVWPLGTLEHRPFQRAGDRLTGPGVFDMKAGLVQLVWSLRALEQAGLARPDCTLLLNGDEETGSFESSGVILDEARRSRAALVFEASVDGAIKTARKSVGLFTIHVEGVQAHAGLDPRAGANAILELAKQILECEQANDLAAGTSLNVGVVRGGTRRNVAAGSASADLDVRVSTEAERQRVEDALSQLRPVDPRTRVWVTGDWNRPVFERTPAVAAISALARRCAAQLGFELAERAVGGASDGNFASSTGIPVLDGVGAVGGGAHARHEYATVSGMVQRAALTACVLSSFA